MSLEQNENPARPRRQPKLFPAAPEPLEPAPLPRPVFRLRANSDEPRERANPDKQRELFFLNWKAQNPRGQADSEDFERAYGDHQILQFEAKNLYRDRSESMPLATMVGRFFLVLILLVAGFATVKWWSERNAPRPGAPRKASAVGQPGAHGRWPACAASSVRRSTTSAR